MWRTALEGRERNRNRNRNRDRVPGHTLLTTTVHGRSFSRSSTPEVKSASLNRA